MVRIRRFAIAAATSTAIVVLLTFGTYALHLWVGGHLSVRDFILRSFVLFPFAIGIVACLWPSANVKHAPLAGSLAGAAFGLIYGYLAPRALYGLNLWRATGHWPHLRQMEWEVDLAALLCGGVAGTCAMLLSIQGRSRVVMVTIGFVVIAAVLVPAPAFDFINHNQELTVAIVTPYSSSPVSNEPRVVADVYSSPLDVTSTNRRVEGLLRNAGITGQYRVTNLFRQGHGKKALAVIVLNQPIVEKVELEEPYGSDVIYVQQPNRWNKIPAQLPTLARPMIFGPLSMKNGLAELTISEAGGWSTGLSIWESAPNN